MDLVIWYFIPKHNLIPNIALLRFKYVYKNQIFPKSPQLSIFSPQLDKDETHVGGVTDKITQVAILHLLLR